MDTYKEDGVMYEGPELTVSIHDKRMLRDDVASQLFIKYMTATNESPDPPDASIMAKFAWDDAQAFIDAYPKS